MYITFICFVFSSTESTLSDSELDSCDLHDVKFIPNVSSFVLDSQENLRKSHAKKAARTKCEHKLAPLGDDYITCAVVGTLTDKSNTQRHKGTLQQDCFPQNYGKYFSSQDDVPMVYTGSLLPEFPELRDSYDQFCMSEHSSRDDLDGKLSNRGSSMAVLCELKSARGMRDSMYSSDESVHACKRRRKTILEQVDADGKNHRWSMPEFTKLWKDYCDSDPDYYLNDQYDSFVHQKHRQSFSEQSTQTCSTPVLSQRNSNQCLLEYPHYEDNTADYPNIEKTKATAKERIVLGESKSCPSLVSVERSTSYDARDYDSSGFYDDSGDDSLTSSPMHSRTSVNTVKENPQWHGYKADLKDSGIYANEDVDSTASVSEINVYASDSGYSGMSKGARDSLEGDETYFDQIEEKHVDKLSQPKHVREISNSRVDYTNNEDFENYDNGHVCDLDPHFKNHHKAHLGRDALHGEKGKRCAQLMQEYIVNRTLDSYPPSSSFYRTSTV